MSLPEGGVCLRHIKPLTELTNQKIYSHSVKKSGSTEVKDCFFWEYLKMK